MISEAKNKATDRSAVGLWASRLVQNEAGAA